MWSERAYVYLSLSTYIYIYNNNNVLAPFCDKPAKLAPCRTYRGVDGYASWLHPHSHMKGMDEACSCHIR